MFPCSRLARPVFQYIARLAVEHLADFLQRIETHALHLPRFQQRDILLRDAYAFGKLLRAHLALGQHDVEVHDYRHCFSLYDQAVGLFEFDGAAHDLSQYEEEKPGHQHIDTDCK
jgi:hypothetical protein